jgi:hypothetical protein
MGGNLESGHQGVSDKGNFLKIKFRAFSEVDTRFLDGIALIDCADFGIFSKCVSSAL